MRQIAQKHGLHTQQFCVVGSTTCFPNIFAHLDTHTRDDMTICTNLSDPSLNHRHGSSLFQFMHDGSRLNSHMLNFVNVCFHCTSQLMCFPFFSTFGVLKEPQLYGLLGPAKETRKKKCVSPTMCTHSNTD